MVALSRLDDPQLKNFSTALFVMFVFLSRFAPASIDLKLRDGETRSFVLPLIFSPPTLAQKIVTCIDVPGSAR